jgi:hypothetical protein
MIRFEKLDTSTILEAVDITYYAEKIISTRSSLDGLILLNQINFSEGIFSGSSHLCVPKVCKLC